MRNADLLQRNDVYQKATIRGGCQRERRMRLGIYLAVIGLAVPGMASAQEPGMESARETGHIVDSIEQATVNAPRVMMLDRRAVRRRFEERFTAARMAKDYVQVYNSVIRANAKLVPDQAEPLHATAAELANEPSESVH
jgi:hypothetical protein